MTRTPIAQRTLPDYTRGEEWFHTISHLVGVGFGFVALFWCLIVAARYGDVWSVVSGAIYALSMIALYAMSSIYHGLRPGMGKKIMQILDHCTIYIMIAGTYTPVLLASLRRIYPVIAWGMFAVIWGCAAVAIAFTAIDLKKYEKFSMACYLIMGWCIVLFLPQTVEAVSIQGMLLFLYGGIAYTVGAIFYARGKNHRYAHGVFHVFILVASVLHFVAVIRYVLPL